MRTESDLDFDTVVAETLAALPDWVRESGNAGELPDVIYLFRKPHLEMGLPPEELRDEIAKTLIHEIAHYFGIDDDHLDDIGWG